MQEEHFTNSAPLGDAVSKQGKVLTAARDKPAADVWGPTVFVSGSGT